MRTKTFKKDKINIITLGCSKNMVDSEVLSEQLRAGDYEIVHENRRKDHNIVIVNTCGFIDKAKEESINTILQQVALKRRGRLDKVYVTGCLSERYKNNLENEIECPRCHDVMTLCSDFDFLYYKCEECHLPLYTAPNSD